jgi:hypothetical protein
MLQIIMKSFELLFTKSQNLLEFGAFEETNSAT